ncbi:hypothetical protein LINGRAHAP2_LOCUS19365 [Linum grandiflorum]
MATSVTRILLVIWITTSALQAADAITVTIYNLVERGVPGSGDRLPITVQCSSKNDPIPKKLLNYDENYKWGFGLALKTLFWCDLELPAENMRLHYDAFDRDKTDYKFDSVVWEVKYAGVYFQETNGTRTLFAGWSRG